MSRRIIAITTAAMLTGIVSHAGISIIDKDTDSGSGGTGVSVTGTVSSTIPANAGDVIVLTASTNKKGDVSPLTAVQTGGSGSAGPQTLHSNSMSTYPTSWIWYQTVTTPGTFEYEITGTAITALFGLYVVRADSSEVEVANEASWDDTISPGNPATHALNYTFGTALTDGILIESVSARLDGLEEASGTYTLDHSGAGVGSGWKRSLLSYDGITGSSWSSVYTVTDGAENTSGGAGIILSEKNASPLPPSFNSNPVAATDAIQDIAYTASLTEYASDPNNDPMTFWATNGPAWLTVDPSGDLYGTPLSAHVGTNTWDVWVTDGIDGTNSSTLQITVQPPAPPVASPNRTRLHPTNSYNVLFIPIDDMRPLIDAYGETDPLRPDTPNMDMLAESGVMFLNAHCQQAVCNASRASLMTGLRPDTTMCWKLDTHFRTPLPDIITLPQHFGHQGYTVHGIGKIYHGITSFNQDEALSWNDGWADPSTGNTWYEDGKWQAEDGGNNKISATDAGEFDYRSDINGTIPVTDEGYNDGNAAALGVARIAAYAADYQSTGTPFFLAVGFQKPHLPFNCPKEYWDLYDPADIDLTTYTGIRNMPVGSNKFTAPYGGEPKAFDDVTGTSDNGMPTATEARHLIHGYLACVSFIDDQIGKLLDALEDPDGNPLTDDSIADNTIVILWGDHGFHLGDHNGFWAKHSNYEISTRVPLIVRTPGLEDLGAAGQHCSSLVELVDIYPTLVDLCALPSPAQPSGKYLQGTTFLPLLEDPAQPWKHAVFSQFQRTVNSNEPGDVPVSSSGPGMGYSIRTERYRYTEWWVTESTDETDRHIIKAGITSPGLKELYDYVADPGETTNLASNVAYSNLVAELSTLLNNANMTSAGDGWQNAPAAAPDAYPETSAEWEAGYLFPGRSAAELDFAADTDGDDIPNKLEYKFGTHPFETNAPQVIAYSGSDRLSYTYPDVEVRTNVVLSVETNTDLTTNTWTAVGTIQSNITQRGNAIIKSASVTTADPERFLRLQATEL